tara:strand:- start:110771 stop:111211 length:441 start_codon:yes stop_codon:yes gene_type:complete
MTKKKNAQIRMGRTLAMLIGLAVGIPAGLVGLIIGVIGSRVLLNDYGIYFDIGVITPVACSTASAILVCAIIYLPAPEPARSVRVRRSLISTVPCLVLWMLIMFYSPEHVSRVLMLSMVLVGYAIGCISLLVPIAIEVFSKRSRSV